VPFNGVTTIDGQNLTVSDIIIKDVDYSKPTISSKSNIIAGSNSYLESTYTGTCNVSLPIISDNLTEGYEGFRIALYDSSTATTPVALSDVVVINDTSRTPPSTYNISPNKTSVNEGETVIFSVTTKNVPSNATTIYWAATGNIQDSDVGTPKGTLNLVNGGGSISIMARKDYVTGERNESFYLEFRARSTSGDAYYTSPSVIINANDT
jgi:hypothetical protein